MDSGTGHVSESACFFPSVTWFLWTIETTKMPEAITIKDFARRVAVSMGTVDRALHNDWGRVIAQQILFVRRNARLGALVGAT